MAPVGGNDKQSDLLYGLHTLRETLRAGTRSIIRLLVVRQDGQFAEVVRLAREADIPVQVRPKAALDRLVPTGKHQGVVAMVGAKIYVSEDDILDFAREQNQSPVVLLLDGLEDPHNLGAILRTAESAGVHGVILPDRRAVGVTSTVAKASAGAVEHLRLASVTNLSKTIESLKKKGLWVYAFDPEASKPYTALDFTGPVAFVFGGEGKGLRPGVRSKCDDRGFIPMQGQVESLNVSAACAIVLYEMVRQRMP